MVGCVGSVSIAGDDSCMSHSGTQLNSNNSDDIQNYVENVLTGPLALPRYTVANLLLIPVDRYPYRMFAVTDGAGVVVQKYDQIWLVILTVLQPL